MYSFHITWYVNTWHENKEYSVIVAKGGGGIARKGLFLWIIMNVAFICACKIIVELVNTHEVAVLRGQMAFHIIIIELFELKSVP